LRWSLDGVGYWLALLPFFCCWLCYLSCVTWCFDFVFLSAIGLWACVRHPLFYFLCCSHLLWVPFDAVAGRIHSLFIDDDIFALVSEEKAQSAIASSATERDGFRHFTDPISKGLPPLESSPPPPVHPGILPTHSAGVLAEAFKAYNDMHAGALQQGREQDLFGDAMETKFERLYAKLPHKRESARKSEDKRTKGSKIGAYCFTNQRMVSFCFLTSIHLIHSSGTTRQRVSKIGVAAQLMDDTNRRHKTTMGNPTTFIQIECRCRRNRKGEQEPFLKDTEIEFVFKVVVTIYALTCFPPSPNYIISERCSIGVSPRSEKRDVSFGHCLR